MIRAITPPMRYPGFIFSPEDPGITTKSIAFIRHRLETLQSCGGFYKGFIRINLEEIKSL